MVRHIYPSELQLNKAYTSDIKAAFLDFVAVVERLPVLHYSVDFIFLFFGIMGFIVIL